VKKSGAKNFYYSLLHQHFRRKELILWRNRCWIRYFKFNDPRSRFKIGFWQ